MLPTCSMAKANEPRAFLILKTEAALMQSVNLA